MASNGTTALATEKLAESGLTLEDAKTLHIAIYDGAEVAATGVTSFALPGLLFNYMDPWKPGEPLRPRPKHDGFKRVRFLGAAPTGASGKAIRYVQAKDSGCCAYFPTNMDWSEIRNDTNCPVIFTEGELKAAKTCERGFPCIGLGGVSNFVNTSMGIGFLRELEAMDWVNRRVFICYDNDGQPKPDVMAALDRLARELEERGAVPYTVALPAVPGLPKTGLDDYFVAFPDPAKFIELLRGAEALTIAQPLWEMNERCAVIADPTVVVDKVTGQFMSPAAFRDVLFADHTVPEQRVQADGTISMKKVPVAKHWMQWPLHARLSGITYAPGQPRIVDDKWNQWEGWGATPFKGSVAPFTKLIDHLFSNTTKEAKEWFLRWCAYPIQHPGAKMFTAVVLHGSTQGTGKSFVGYSLGEVYGAHNFSEVKQKELFSDFNGWSVNKQLVMGDDITGSSKRDVADMLKNFITCKRQTINIKFLPTYNVPDCVNYFFTSNQPDAFYLEDTDRRFFIHEVPSQPLPQDFYKQYEAWIFSEEGRSALMHYLLNLPMGDFDHRARALMTEAKAEMMDLGRSDIGAWVVKLKQAPDALLVLGKVRAQKDLFTSDELRTYYVQNTDHPKVTANAIARNMKQQGFKLAHDGMSIKLANAPSGRFFIVRNEDKWLNATAAQIRKHLEGR